IRQGIDCDNFHKWDATKWEILNDCNLLKAIHHLKRDILYTGSSVQNISSSNGELLSLSPDFTFTDHCPLSLSMKSAFQWAFFFGGAQTAQMHFCYGRVDALSCTCLTGHDQTMSNADPPASTRIDNFQCEKSGGAAWMHLYDDFAQTDAPIVQNQDLKPV
ncbi:uncharacterized protein LACBIDRAFT_325099, partial [Laccaria bicolor S238N-H82]